MNGEPADNYTALAPVLDPDVVSISGAESVMDRVSTVYISADISQINSNYSKRLPVEVLDKDGVNITSLLKVSPATVELLVPVIYTQPEKTLSVSPSIIGEPAAGFEVSRVVTSPNTVIAYGDQGLLNDLNYISTSPIDVSNLNETSTFSVQLQHSDAITLSTETATVVVYIEASYSQTFPDHVVELRNAAEGLSWTPQGENWAVTVYGPETDVSRINAENINLYVDLSGITEPGTYTLPIQAELPANVYLSTISPAELEVIVTLTGSDGGGDNITEEGSDHV